MPQHIETKDLMLAVRILAACDALFVPWRTWCIGQASNAVGERRQAFRSQGGIEFVGGGLGFQREQHSQALASARRAGLLAGTTTSRPRVQLTPHGADVARASVGCWLIRDSWDVLESIERLTGLKIVNGSPHAPGFVPEYAILNHASGNAIESRELVGLENRLLPALVDGLLVSSSDRHGHTAYRLTEAGRTALAAGRPDEPASLLSFNDEQAALYDAEFHRGLATRNTWRPDTKDLSIPLSAGLWPRFTPEVRDA